MRIVLPSILFSFLLARFASAAEPGKVSFNRDIRGILSENCFHCHGPDAQKRKADLRLDQKSEALESLLSSAKNGEKTPILSRIFSRDPDEVMPPPKSNRHLSQSQKQLLKDWIDQGAPYENHWAFDPPRRPNVPDLSQSNNSSSDVGNPIDAFVLRRLREEDWNFSPPAKKHVLLRRVYFDLIGLPPSAAQVRAFLEDDSPEAYEKVVDELFASPHYGERMALPWLDAARYADSNGFQQDGDRHQYIWRDWVVRMMNKNQPFDQFTIEQIAGDLLENPTQDQVIATGFNRNHMLNGEGGAIAEEQRNNNVFDRVQTTATVWLGLTMICAQCHDHKYDPLTQEDYYRFFAYFNNLPETGKVDSRTGRIMLGKPVLTIATEEQTAQKKQLAKELGANKKTIANSQKEIDSEAAKWWSSLTKENAPGKLKAVVGRAFSTLDGYNTRYVREHFLRQSDQSTWREAQQAVDRLTGEIDKLSRAMPAVMVMEERKEIRKTHILNRGDYESPGREVTPGVPAALSPLPANAPANRLGLARWLVDRANPLTARVAVNRQWQHFFGTGLVKTAEDFGVQGEAPSHPDLLDWLAVDFVESGWDVKRLQRLFVTSRTYRQSSFAPPRDYDRDPENRLLSRASRFRLPSMLIRDQALSLSGLLNKNLGGSPVYPYQPEGLWKEFSYEKFHYKPDSGDKLYRRSIYTFWRRTLGPPNLFDTANRQTCAVNIRRTNTPLHALTTLNGPAFVEASRIWAEEMIAGEEPGIANAFFRAASRMPNKEETEILYRTLRRAREQFRRDPEAAADLLQVGERKANPNLDPVEVASHAQVAQLILNLDETLNRQ